MDRQHILNEIRRTAKENGLPLGRDRFQQETGIRYADWYGKYWVRWNDAVREAGLSPNTFQQAYDENELIRRMIELIREIGHYPVAGDLRMKKARDASFPNDKAFYRNFGSSAELRQSVRDYCQTQGGFEDVIALCGSPLPSNKKPDKHDEGKIGFVYLAKSGRHYKIGKTNALGRREYELAIQMPERLRTVHVIRTDDADGIEEYWHKRFAAKRANGEWFNLDAGDVQAFKRRKFM